MVLISQLVFELLIFRSRISQGNGGGSVVRNAVGFDGGSASSYRRLAEWCGVPLAHVIPRTQRAESLTRKGWTKRGDPATFLHINATFMRFFAIFAG